MFQCVYSFESLPVPLPPRGSVLPYSTSAGGQKPKCATNLCLDQILADLYRHYLLKF